MQYSSRYKLTLPFFLILSLSTTLVATEPATESREEPPITTSTQDECILPLTIQKRKKENFDDTLLTWKEFLITVEKILETSMEDEKAREHLWLLNTNSPSLMQTAYSEISNAKKQNCSYLYRLSPRRHLGYSKTHNEHQKFKNRALHYQQHAGRWQKKSPGQWQEDLKEYQQHPFHDSGYHPTFIGSCIIGAFLLAIPYLFYHLLHMYYHRYDRPPSEHPYLREEGRQAENSYQPF